jgi:molecular chaperone DnaK (HSP70)
MPVLAESIGITTLADPFTVVLKRGQAVPTEFSANFSNAENEQSALQISLVAGDPAPTGLRRELGGIAVPDLPLAVKGGLRVQISVAVDADGFVMLSARHPKTDQEISAPLGKVAIV